MTLQPESEKRDVWLHVHVPKAGGSTLRQLMNRNFGKGYYNSSSLLETKQYTLADVSEIIRCHPHVRCMSDHKLSLELPYFHDHANVYAICYVRDPIERFISRYFFHRHFEEVACIAQRLTFRDFANAELVDQFAHPQTNSQIYFLNGGVSFDDLGPIHRAIETGRCYLFPIERFDESCAFLEKRFPQHFSDLSYVRANVSKKDATIAEEDREFVTQYLKRDYPVFELANAELDRCLAETFTPEELQAALEDFRDRCSRRYHNFHPPRPRAVPPAPAKDEPSDNQTDAVPAESQDTKETVASDHGNHSPVNPNSEGAAIAETNTSEDAEARNEEASNVAATDSRNAVASPEDFHAPLLRSPTAEPNSGDDPRNDPAPIP